MSSIRKFRIIWLVVFSLFISCQEIFKQDLKSEQLIENRSIYLNGGLRSSFGGKSRTFIKVDLPPNTVSWYYSFSTSKGKSGAKNLDLALQMSALLAIPTGLTSTALSGLEVPDGDASLDIFLLDASNMGLFINKEDLNGHPFEFIWEGTANNTKQAVVQIDDVTSGTWYLGIKNPSSLNAISVNIEVVAIVDPNL